MQASRTGSPPRTALFCIRDRGNKKDKTNTPFLQEKLEAIFRGLHNKISVSLLFGKRLHHCAIIVSMSLIVNIEYERLYLIKYYFECSRSGALIECQVFSEHSRANDYQSPSSDELGSHGYRYGGDRPERLAVRVAG
jgi:hypothetical protein